VGRAHRAAHDSQLKDTSVTRRSVPYLFIFPFFVAFALFLVIPIGYAIYLSLFEVQHQALGPDITVFAPLNNYIRAFTDSDFTSSLLNILRYAVVQVPAMVILAAVIALILDGRRGRLRSFFRISVFLPYAIPGVIAGLLWSYLYSPDISPINQWLTSLHVPTINFIDPNIILGSVGNIVIWVATGYNAIILFAALQNIPQELYDAASIDGATPRQVIRFIKLPMLRPALLLITIFSVIGATQIFGEPYMLRSLGYVPDNITPNTVIYNAATRDGNFNYGAALAVSLGVITFVASGIFLWLATRERKS